MALKSPKNLRLSWNFKYKLFLGVLTIPESFSLIGVMVREIRPTTRMRARRARKPRGGVKKPKIPNFLENLFFTPRGVPIGWFQYK